MTTIYKNMSNYRPIGLSFEEQQFLLSFISVRLASTVFEVEIIIKKIETDKKSYPGFK